MKTIVPVAVLSLAVAVPALADGGFFAPWLSDIYEHEQVALLDWNAAGSVETLTILPGFQGDMQEFAWVVPLPAEPELRPADAALFQDLFAMTSPRRHRRDESWGCERSSQDYLGAPGDADGGVDVLQHDVVGIYDVMVLAADDATSLVDSLDVWGYLHAGNRDLAELILADYVQRAWVFATLRVDSVAFAQSFPDDDPHRYRYYGLDPITFTFTVDAPIYPLRISAVSTTPDARVTIFTCADARLTFEGAQTRYANRLTDEELTEIARPWPDAAAALRAGCTLTRLERTMGAADMDTDLALVRSPDQDEFRPIVYYSGVGDAWWVLVGMIAVWLLGRGSWRRRRRRVS